MPCFQSVRDGDARRDAVCPEARRGLDRRSRRADQPLAAGKVNLASYKRPRPIVLRANEGDCLEICFTNLLGTVSSVVTVKASVHVQGLEVVDSLNDDGSWVGRNE